MRPSELALAYCSQGAALIETREFDAALARLDEAIALEPGLADAHCNRGLVLAEMKKFDAALGSLDQAVALDADFAVAHANRGAVLQELGRWAEAAASYERAVALAPERGFLLGHIAHARMQLCDWDGLEACAARVTQRLQRGEPACAPFPALALIGSASLQRRAAEIWVRMKYPPDASLGAIGPRARGGKIRIGYFSADFREHAVSFLTADLFETHDRSSFEVWGFSFGVNTQDAMRRRLELGFDRFIDVRQQSDRSIALLARSMQLDIGVDLGGFTKDARPGIFALRAAPLQVSYLGFLGTMGAPYMDYLIADAAILPPGQRVNYAEQVLCLPTYQVNDAKRRIADKSFTREELGLPAAGFVFCCFNASYKITRATFAGWMRILLRAPGSVLLLLAANDTVKGNLSREAERGGVNPDRLVFADRLPMPEYLARYRAADLFLDTLPYNAGTTASDALWAGVPVLTCAGETFAGRVAASLLTAVGMPELVAATQEEYEDLAVALAAQPERLAEFKQRLSGARSTAPLFNTPLFTRTLEAGYAAIYDRYQAGLAPQHVALQARSER